MIWLVAGLVVILVCVLVALFAALVAKGVICILALAVAVTTRVSLVLRGYLFEPGQVRLLDLALAAAILVIVAVFAYHLLSDVNAEQRTAWVAAVLALPVAAYAVLQLVVPAAPAQAGAPACGGAPLAGSNFQAKTGEFGLNARSGPGTTFAPQRRFDANCTVGVDGYCVGESVGDISVPLPDVRWLRLRHTDSYVAAGAVFSLSPEADLGAAPEDDCPLGLDDPALDGAVEIVKTGPETLEMTARPLRTRLVGFGLYYEQADRAEPVIPFVGLAEGLVLTAMRRAGVPLQLASSRLCTDGAEVLYDYGKTGEDEDAARAARELVVVRSEQRPRSTASQQTRTWPTPNGWSWLGSGAGPC